MTEHTLTTDRVAATANLRVIEHELRRLFARSRTWSTQTATAVHPELNPALYALLMDVVTEAPVRSVDLADRRGVSKSVISRQVAALEDLDLIHRAVDPTDARASVIVLTAKGRAAASTIEASRRTYLKKLFDDLSADDLAQLAHSLGRLNDVLD